MEKMGEKKGLLIVFLFMILIFGVGLSEAENLNLRITGSVNNITSDVYLKTNPSSVNNLDTYDMFAGSLPSGNYSQFYSNVNLSELSVDSWALNPRTVNLTYLISYPQTGTITFSWPLLTGSYAATFIYYGNDSNYSNVVGSSDMRKVSSYSPDISSDSNLYMQVVVNDYVPPQVPSPPSGGSGGGGGGGGAPKKVAPVLVDTDSINVPIIVGTNKTKIITITNPGNSSITVSLKSSEFGDILSLNQTSFLLGPGQKRDVELNFNAPDSPGIYLGKILVNGQTISVSVDVSSGGLLFDVEVIIPDQYKVISDGSNLSVQISLIPFGGKLNSNVTLNYFIKDFDGKIFYHENNTFLIQEQEIFKKDFATSAFPPGDYVIGLELTYPNGGVATSSAIFKIQENSNSSPTKIKVISEPIFWWLVIGLIVLLVIFILIHFILMPYLRRIKIENLKQKF
jgi:hypothetical protein